MSVETNIKLYPQRAEPAPGLTMTLTGPKLHGLRITESALHYHGSITIDADILDLAGLYVLEFVNIWNKCSGIRISTYLLPGTRGSGVVCLNGAAARSCQVGDEVIITSERSVSGGDLINPDHTFRHCSRVLTFVHEPRINTVDQKMEYRLTTQKDGSAHFELVNI